MAINKTPVKLPKRKKSLRGYKVMRDNFTHRTKQFADASKKEMRRAATTENAFPQEKDTFALGVLQNVATKGPMYSEEFEETFGRALYDPETLKRIITYVRGLSFFAPETEEKLVGRVWKKWTVHFVDDQSPCLGTS